MFPMPQKLAQDTLSALRAPAHRGRILLGLIWCADGLLKLQPSFRHHFVSGVIDPSAAGQPAAVAHLITSIGGLVSPHQAIFAVLAAVTEISIGIGLLIPRTVKPALVVSFAWAINVWLTGEGLGGLLAGVTPTPLTGVVGTAPLYIVAGLLVWPRRTTVAPAVASAAAPGRGDAGELGLIGRTGGQALWAALWLSAAAFWLFPANAAAGALRTTVANAPSGTPWLTSLHSAAAHALGNSGMTAALVLALCSVEIGLSVLNGRGTRIALWTSIAISLLFWVLAEGMGGLFTGQATDLGTGPMMILIAGLLLPLSSPRSAPAAIGARVRPLRSVA